MEMRALGMEKLDPKMAKKDVISLRNYQAGRFVELGGLSNKGISHTFGVNWASQRNKGCVLAHMVTIKIVSSIKSMLLSSQIQSCGNDCNIPTRN